VDVIIHKVITVGVGIRFRMGIFGKRFQDLGLLFITNTVLNWSRIFHLRRYAEIVMGSLRYCIEHQWFKLFVYVLMPNHIHLILKVKDYEYSSARFYLKDIEDKYLKLSDFCELL